MDRITEHLIEKGSGIGKLIGLDETLFDDVKYEYRVFQKITTTDTSTGSMTMPGLKSLEGSVELLNKKEPLVGKVFFLEMSDGKKWKILISAGGYPLTTYSFLKAA